LQQAFTSDNKTQTNNTHHQPTIYTDFINPNTHLAIFLVISIAAC